MSLLITNFKSLMSLSSSSGSISPFPSHDISIMCHTVITAICFIGVKEGKGKAVPLQDWSGPEGSRKLGFPDFLTTAQDGGKGNGVTLQPRRGPEGSRK
jgi:hypothetical protein